MAPPDPREMGRGATPPGPPTASTVLDAVPNEVKDAMFVAY